MSLDDDEDERASDSIEMPSTNELNQFALFNRRHTCTQKSQAKSHLQGWIDETTISIIQSKYIFKYILELELNWSCHPSPTHTPVNYFRINKSMLLFDVFHFSPVFHQKLFFFLATNENPKEENCDTLTQYQRISGCMCCVCLCLRI